MKGPRHVAIAMVRVYQVALSPVKGLFFGGANCCRYFPTCSCYAIEALRAHGLFRGLILTVRRLLRCHPWGGAGVDLVPPAKATMNSSRASSHT